MTSTPPPGPGAPAAGPGRSAAGAPGRPARPPLYRSVRDRWVAGVAAGLAEHLGLPVPLVRWGFVLGAPLGGASVLAYALLWVLVPSAPGVCPGGTGGSGPGRMGPGRSGPGRPVGSAPGVGVPDAGAPGSGSAGRSPSGPGRSGAGGLRWSGDAALLRQRLPEVLVGAALVAVGGAQLASRAGWGVDPLTVTALLVVGAGAVLTWSQVDRAERERWLASAGGGTRPGVVRLAVGVVLAVVGMVLLVSDQVDAAALRGGLLAAGAVLVGVGLLVAPWVLQVGRDLVAERSARIREEERSEIAAHLHDSVLQTLSLIQRRSADPVEVNRLARAQERQLREWLYSSGQGPQADGGPSGVAAAVRAAVARVEDEHAVAVDVVTVGDVVLDADRAALVLALREAVLNAVRHGAPPVSVYVESGPDAVEAFVRDRGPGVDLDAIPPDRLGVRESVIGRMERHGGRAVVRRAPGGGTEVALLLGAGVATGSGGPDDRPGREGTA